MPGFRQRGPSPVLYAVTSEICDAAPTVPCGGHANVGNPRASLRHSISAGDRLTPPAALGLHQQRELPPGESVLKAMTYGAIWGNSRTPAHVPFASPHL
jgi:hypothetical protein